MPQVIYLHELGFHHWLAERTNTLYLVDLQQQQLVGLRFSVNNHAGNQIRTRQCDLCRSFLMVADVISIRSMRRSKQKGVEYLTNYSYICRDLDDCRKHIDDRGYLDQLIELHT